MRTIIDHNPKRRRRNQPEEEDEEDEEDEDGEREAVDDDTWAYSQVNLKGALPTSR